MQARLQNARNERTLTNAENERELQPRRIGRAVRKAGARRVVRFPVDGNAEVPVPSSF